MSDKLNFHKCVECVLHTWWRLQRVIAICKYNKKKFVRAFFFFKLENVIFTFGYFSTNNVLNNLSDICVHIQITALNYQIKWRVGVERAASSWWAEPNDVGSQIGRVVLTTNLCEGRVMLWPRWCPAVGSAPPHCAVLFQGCKPAGSLSVFSPRRRAQTARHHPPAGCPICTGVKHTEQNDTHTGRGWL